MSNSQPDYHTEDHSLPTFGSTEHSAFSRFRKVRSSEEIIFACAEKSARENAKMEMMERLNIQTVWLSDFRQRPTLDSIPEENSRTGNILILADLIPIQQIRHVFRTIVLKKQNNCAKNLISAVVCFISLILGQTMADRFDAIAVTKLKHFISEDTSYGDMADSLGQIFTSLGFSVNVFFLAVDNTSNYIFVGQPIVHGSGSVKIDVIAYGADQNVYFEAIVPNHIQPTGKIRQFNGIVICHNILFGNIATKAYRHLTVRDLPAHQVVEPMPVPASVPTFSALSSSPVRPMTMIVETDGRAVGGSLRGTARGPRPAISSRLQNRTPYRSDDFTQHSKLPNDELLRLKDKILHQTQHVVRHQPAQQPAQQPEQSTSQLIQQSEQITKQMSDQLKKLTESVNHFD